MGQVGELGGAHGTQKSLKLRPFGLNSEWIAGTDAPGGNRGLRGGFCGNLSPGSPDLRNLAYPAVLMQNGLLFFRWVFTGLFLLTLVGGIVFFRNNGGFFKADPDMPSENSSARTFNKAQMLLIWAHALVLTACMALRLH
jgi:hypothetical protein